MVGASPLRVAFAVSLPMVRPAIAFSAVLVFFLGFELFGLPLVLGDPEGRLVLTTYLYKLTNILGTPSYQLMAVVVVVIGVVAAPLVCAAAPAAARCGPLRVDARQGARVGAACGSGALALAGAAPDPGCGSWSRSWSRSAASRCARSSSPGAKGCRLLDVLTLQHYRDLANYPNVLRGIVNTLGVGMIGGAAAVACYTALALALHRWQSGWVRGSSTTWCCCRGPCRGSSPGSRSCGSSCSSSRSPRCGRPWSRSGSPTRSSGSPTACGSCRARCSRSGRSWRRRRGRPGRARCGSARRHAAAGPKRHGGGLAARCS